MLSGYHDGQEVILNKFQWAEGPLDFVWWSNTLIQQMRKQKLQELQQFAEM